MISSDDSFSAFIGGDIRFTVDTIKFSTWLDVEFGRSNQNDGDIKFLWVIKKSGGGFFSSLHEGFVASKNVCGKFDDAPEGRLAIYFRTANNDLLEKQECYLRTLAANISRYDFDVLNSLIESSFQLFNLIVAIKPALKKFSDIVPEYDYENAELTEKVTKFDRSEKSMRSKLTCLQSEFQKRGMQNLLSESDVLVLAKHFEGDSKRKNKISLIKAGLSDETVVQNKKYLLRLLNFTRSSAEFYQKLIR